MDILVGQKAVDHLGLLQSRGPSWLSWPLGYVVSTALMSALGFLGLAQLEPGLISMMIQPLSLGVGGFFGLTLILSTLICPIKERSFANLLSAQISLGHTLLLFGFAAVAYLPAAAPLGPTIIGAVPFVSRFVPENMDLVFRLGPAYILALTVFSLFAPVSLILFRYVSLSKRT